MKRLMMLAVAAGALAGVQAVSATPAAAGGCYGYGCGCASYYRPVSCCARHYRVVRYYRVLKVRHYRRACCR